MKKIILVILTIFLSIPIFANSEWTVLIYMAADNTLCDAAFDDINEMESVTYNDSVRIVVQVDPLDDPSSDFDFTEARRYLITYDENPDSIGSLLLVNMGEINSADPTEVYSFANWGFNKYPSKKKMLILWDHGNGWSKYDEITKSVCNDDNSGDNISVANGELKQAISNINYHLDIIAFDACLMQMPEVIGEIYEYCDFIIGSEDNVPEDGIFYGEYKEFSCSSYAIFNYLAEYPKCTSEEFSSIIVERYIDSYTMGCQSTGIELTISSIKTSHFSEFQNTLANFTETFSDTIYYDIYSLTYSQCHTFYFGKNVDVWQFFSILSDCAEEGIQDSVQNILLLLDSLIVNSKTTYKDELGRITIYFPQTHNRFIADWHKYYQLSFVKKSRWDRFLNFYYNNDNEQPEILYFSITTQDDLIHFSWNAIDPAFIKYFLGYRKSTDTTFISILDSTSQQNYQSNLPYDNYTFCLTAEDEFGNVSDSSRVVFLLKNQTFMFIPNPYIISENSNGRFIFTIENSEKAEIYIYNLAGELVRNLRKICNENSTCELEFSPKNLSSGIYLCLLKTSDITDVIKIAIIK